MIGLYFSYIHIRICIHDMCVCVCACVSLYLCICLRWSTCRDIFKELYTNQRQTWIATFSLQSRKSEEKEEEQAKCCCENGWFWAENPMCGSERISKCRLHVLPALEGGKWFWCNFFDGIIIVGKSSSDSRDTSISEHMLSTKILEFCLSRFGSL